MLAQLKFNARPVLVTGAGSGIGRATCEVFAELGATVIMAGRRMDPLRETEERLRPFGGETACFTCDVSNEADVAKLYDQVAQRWTGLKALVNNAGGNRPGGSVTELTADAWHSVMSSNVYGTFYMLKHFMPLLLADGGAAVVNVGSIVGGMMGFPGNAAYAASKGAVAALTTQAAVDYAASGIRINTISPGITATENPVSEKGRQLRDFMAQRTALKREAATWEIANVIVFMASDAATFLHGANVVVDGGRTIT